ncbi:MAG: glycosyltransferase family 4 protein [Candidatus Schekmanbacteria bacterium]|nr:glycosyltransferase family 4 protein [Candidatus Schekmanbacteria bacterium]
MPKTRPDGILDSMKLGIVLDNRVNKWSMQRFEPMKEEIDITVFVGERNRYDIGLMELKKQPLFHAEEILLGAREPIVAYKRFWTSYRRMDFYYFSLKKYLKNMDVVFSSDHMRSAYTLSSLKDKLGFKFVLAWWENIPFRCILDPKTHLMQKSVLDKVDLFLPYTETAKNAMLVEGIPEEKIEVVYPGIDLERFKPSNPPEAVLRKYNIPKGNFVVLYVGKLVSWKGVHNLVYAAKILRDWGIKDFVVAVAGQGAQKENMESIIQQSNLKEHFRFLDFVSYADMPDVFKMSDVLVLPSYPIMTWQEQFGMVLAEAMATGKPVISTLSGSIPEVIGNAGMLIPAGDFFALAKKIQELMENKPLREKLGSKGRERAETLFDAKKNSQKLAKIIKRL